MSDDVQQALAQVREALEAGPTPREWLIAGEDKSFVYSLGPHGTNAFWAHVQAAGPERISEAEKGANAKLIAACSPANMTAILAHVEAQAAENARLRAALNTCAWALRQPLDEWKGVCERKALDEARDALKEQR